jgi:apolipoprotein D and lipocalin family protein
MRYDRHLLLGLATLLAGCVGIPADVPPVNGFALDRYLGTWYEIARLDHRFERGLEKVTADYRLREDGHIEVVNRGFDPRRKAWKKAVGQAAFVGDPSVGRLKVSFFGPFYSGYNIIALDHAHYAWALVCGPTREYLWLLARQPRMDSRTQATLIARAQALGFDTARLILVSH